jgi:hypothetical protein
MALLRGELDISYQNNIDHAQANVRCLSSMQDSNNEREFIAQGRQEEVGTSSKNGRETSACTDYV